MKIYVGIAKSYIRKRVKEESENYKKIKFYLSIWFASRSTNTILHQITSSISFKYNYISLNILKYFLSFLKSFRQIHKKS